MSMISFDSALYDPHSADKQNARSHARDSRSYRQSGHGNDLDQQAGNLRPDTQGYY
jgi:hypothetical protein